MRRVKRNIRYLLWPLLLPAWALWSCQSHDNPAPAPAGDEGEEVEVEVDILTRAPGPSDGYVNDLTVMAFWCNDTDDPNDRTKYTFAYYSNVSAGAVLDDNTGRRKARFMIKKEAGKCQRFVFLANLYACNIFPHLFTDSEIAGGIGMREALNHYTYFPKHVTPGGTLADGWSKSAGGQDEPFPMCGETIYSYTFADIEAGKVFILNEEAGKHDEKVYLYRMVAKVDISFKKSAIDDLGDIKSITLCHPYGKGYVGYNYLDGYINSNFNTIDNLNDYSLSSGKDWKLLNAWVVPLPNNESYNQNFEIVPIPNVQNPTDDSYTMKIDGPVYLNEAVRYDKVANPTAIPEIVFIADDGEGYGDREYTLRLENYDILRNCHYHIYINKVNKGSLSAVLEVADWTEVKVNDPLPLPL